jgi:alkanesulfonate monooxygenase SsuD/methylene tetrahydromethanopterin reductase-like flavin-dependent oxidoreductase (luciferase family)
MSRIQFDRIGVQSLKLTDVHRDVELARVVESKGFTSFWTAEPGLGRDGISQIGALSQATDEIVLATGILPIWTRNVAMMAQTWATIYELAGPRVRCGLGLWYEPLASRCGVDRSNPNPLRAAWEYSTVLRRLLDGETVTYEGQYVDVEAIELDVLYGERDGTEAVPIYLAATGPQMNTMVGELVGNGVVDGCVLNCYIPPNYAEECISKLHEGIRKQGGDTSELDLPELILVSMQDDADKAYDAARPRVTAYMGQQPHIARACGAPDDLIETVKAQLGDDYPPGNEALARAAEHVPDEQVERMVCVGTPESVVEQVYEYIEVGITEPVLTRVSGDPDRIVETFAEYLRT